MTRNAAMYKILKFGKKEEKKLLAEGKTHEAYQIEHARENLIYCLNVSPVKKIRTRLEEMTTSSRDEEGYLIYNPLHFVADDFTRNLLLELKKEFK